MSGGRIDNALDELIVAAKGTTLTPDQSVRLFRFLVAHGGTMTRDEALHQLRAICERPQVDQEVDHSDADAILLDLIGDAEITAAWEAVDKWFA